MEFKVPFRLTRYWILDVDTKFILSSIKKLGSRIVLIATSILFFTLIIRQNPKLRNEGAI